MESITRRAVEAAISKGLTSYERKRSLGCGRVYVCIGAYGDILEQNEEVKTANKAITQKHRALVSQAARELSLRYQRKGYRVTNALYIGYDNNSGIELGQGTAIATNLKALGIKAYRSEVGD